MDIFAMGNFIVTGWEILQKLKDEQRNELVSIAKLLLRPEENLSVKESELKKKYFDLVAEIKTYLKT